MHGYDITDYNKLNPEIGSEKEFEDLCLELEKCGVSHVMDVVPNHMGMANDNRWWMDVLEYGPSSPFAKYFDIDWSQQGASELKNKVMVPVLEDDYEKMLEGGKIRLVYEGGCFFVRYYDSKFPVTPKSYPKILEALLQHVGSASQSFCEELQRIAKGFHTTQERKSIDQLKARLNSLSGSSSKVESFMVSSLREFSPENIKTILGEQYYCLAYWKVANNVINYRRFFNINDLVAIRTEIPFVFSESHKLVMALVRQGKISGLRIDHPDGLFDPEQYFLRLQRACIKYSPTRRRPYVVAEKILMPGESLPRWAFDGTTGYDFANQVNGLFVERRNKCKLDQIYSQFTSKKQRFKDVVYESKKHFVMTSMGGESRSLAYQLYNIINKGRSKDIFSIEQLIRGLEEIAACFPVYRTYINTRTIPSSDRRCIKIAVREAKKKNSNGNLAAAIDIIGKILALEVGAKREHIVFAMKFQQFTVSAMGKGLEDTALYRYYRLCSLNEVGGDPENFGVSAREFHEWNRLRSKDWPRTMLTTSTHDTKRSGCKSAHQCHIGNA
jgi:(1->4)-alpha-D-glucan 1-alpha-D-glucosylmutase